MRAVRAVLASGIWLIVGCKGSPSPAVIDADDRHDATVPDSSQPADAADVDARGVDAGGVDAQVDAQLIDAASAGAVQLGGAWTTEFVSPGGLRWDLYHGGPSTIPTDGTAVWAVDDVVINQPILSRWDGRERLQVAGLGVDGGIAGGTAQELEVYAQSSTGVSSYGLGADGTLQSPLMVGNPPAYVWKVVRGGDGLLYAGSTQGFYRYNGGTWQKLSTPSGQVPVSDIFVDGNKLYISGGFAGLDSQPSQGFEEYNVTTGAFTPRAITQGSLRNIRKVNGALQMIGSSTSATCGASVGSVCSSWLTFDPATSTWSGHTEPSNYTIDNVEFDGANYIALASHNFSVDGAVFRLDGSTWTKLCDLNNRFYGSGVVGISSTTLSSGRVLFGGNFDEIVGQTVVNYRPSHVNDYGAVVVEGGACHSVGQGLVGLDASGNRTTPVVDALASAGTLVIAGGVFHGADGHRLSNVGSYNYASARWMPMASGLAGEVRALAFDGTSTYAGGDFTADGLGAPMMRIARFDGTSWRPLGGGTDGAVRALAADGAALYLGGQFVTAGGAAALRVARWTGAAYEPLGAGIDGPAGSVVNSMAQTTDALVVAGSFTMAGGLSASNVASWSKATGTWSSMNGGLDGTVFATTVYNGQVCAGGQFTGYLACWDGAAWNRLPIALDGAVTGLSAGADGKLYVVGDFKSIQQGHYAAHGVAIWDGHQWQVPSNATSDAANGGLHAVLSDGRLYVGGQFLNFGGGESYGIARFAPN